MTTTPQLPRACLLGAWSAHEGELRAWLRTHTSDPDVAEDLLQDLFLRAIRQGDRFCEVRHARGWLFASARHLCIDRLRLRKTEVPIPEALAEAVDEPLPVDGLATCLPRALAELAPTEADILRECDIGGMTQVEYARRHDLSVAGAKSRLQRARRRLKAHLVTACQVRFDTAGKVCCFVPR